ncbi:MAG: Coenzyme F420 hydrogenase/dehydrogenase, beta subunit C-terminal domain [Clostridiales bacterium]|nr:Coenzyme F420 hydrogenase/dehydrogenase, beta subunit C-terminal domain [Clostridiales bacterium]
MLKEIKNKCCGCAACMNICPKKCIVMRQDSEGFYYPYKNKKECIDCDLCIKICPLSREQSNFTNEQIVSYAAYNIEDEIRNSSSSGGIFYLLSEYIIQLNGVCYGASFTQDMKACHIRATTLDTVRSLLGSKYIQSDIGYMFQSVAEDLKYGRFVLFSGTPCQVAGLKTFLVSQANVSTEKLFAVDFVCHDVPSPGIWGKYLNEFEKAKGEKVTEVAFRDKSAGWSKYHFKFTTDQNAYHISIDSDPYFLAFFNNLDLRPSCYNCNFRNGNRFSDITLADFWGVDRELPQFAADDKGVSWVMCNTEKGLNIIEKIRDRVCIELINTQIASQNNISSTTSPCMPKSRDKFFADINKGKDFYKTVFRYTGHSGLLGIMKKIKRKILK